MTERSRESKASPRPSWSGLYALAGLMLGALLLAQALVAAGSELTALQCGSVVVGFVAMGYWTRRNRAALDHLDWCDCASSRMTVRVIASRRGEPSNTRYADAETPGEADSVETTTLEEVAR